MNESLINFALKIFKECEKEGRNTLLSPFSILFALAMVANGSNKITLEQMERAFGLSVEKLTDDLNQYMNNILENKNNGLYIANAICFAKNSDVKLKPEFLKTVVGNFDSQIFEIGPEAASMEDVNKWGMSKTDGMVKELLNQDPKGEEVFLINATAFNREWLVKYDEDHVRDGIFTLKNGFRKKVKMMYSTERGYFIDENAVGFAKYYADAEYEFLAILPKEGLSIKEYIESLTGAKLVKIINRDGWITGEAYSAIPKFEVTDLPDIKDAVMNIGIRDAFDKEKADFSKMADLDKSKDENFFISELSQKAWISVDERGTKAYAFTFLRNSMVLGSVGPKPYYIYLDRPFIYMIIECKSKIPVFMGTIEDFPESELII